MTRAYYFVNSSALESFALKLGYELISLWQLCVLCVSVVRLLRIINHRDTECTEVAQRRAAR